MDLSQNLGINYSFVNSSMPLRAVCSLQNFLVICLASTKIISFGRSHAHSQTATSSTTILIFDKSPPAQNAASIYCSETLNSVAIFKLANEIRVTIEAIKRLIGDKNEGSPDCKNQRQIRSKFRFFFEIS